MAGRGSVFLSGLKMWVTFDGMKGSDEIFRIVKLHTNNFDTGVSDKLLQGAAFDWKQPISKKSISSLSFCPAGVWHIFFETTWPGLEIIGSRILNFWVGPGILGSEWVGTCRKFYFLTWHFYIK
jgi:hypothetical protein